MSTPSAPDAPASAPYSNVTSLFESSSADLSPRIAVFGVGGAGGNAVNNMIKSDLKGVEFYVCNTDAQALKQSLAKTKIQLGPTSTQGLGAGSKPDVGRAAAEEVSADFDAYFKGINMVFVTAGMGGGTGTGAAPVIAQAARDRGLLTVGVVTKPFHFEGSHRMQTAERGIELMQKHVDTLIVIPNQNLFRVANERTTFADAFRMADEVLHAGVRGITDLMIMPGLINLDFADVRTVMSEMGKAMMGTGEAQGDNRAILAAEAAISNPLLDDVSMRGARGVLISITGGEDLTLYEVDEAANRIREEVDAQANIIFGSTFNPELNGKMRVSVVATGIDAQAMAYLRSSPLTQGALNFPLHGAAAVPESDEDAFEDNDTADVDYDEAPPGLFDEAYADAADDESPQDDDAQNHGPLSAAQEARPAFGHNQRNHSHNSRFSAEPDYKPSFLERLGFGGRRREEALTLPTPIVENESAQRPKKSRKPAVKPQESIAAAPPSQAPQKSGKKQEALPLEPQAEDMYDIPAYLRKRK